ncbi:MAG: hydrogenase maturation protease [Tepidisphaeraceae bacterium]|jgi:hydrogenase maturation protease
MKSIATDAPVLVIGYGNVLRGDDGVGWAAARRLARRLPRRLASVLMVHQLLPELAEPISRAKRAIFIDADERLAPGQVCQKVVQPLDRADGTIGHHQSPGGLLRLARDLYGHAPEALVFSIGAADFDFRPTLSTEVRRALPGLLQSVADAVRRLGQDLERCHA